MSVSLVVLRLETADDSPTLKHIEYQGKNVTLAINISYFD